MQCTRTRSRSRTRTHGCNWSVFFIRNEADGLADNAVHNGLSGM